MKALESCPSVEVDSSEIVREAYKKMYGEDIPESADTILNAFIPFLDFCRAKLMLLNYKLPTEQNDLLLVYIHLDEFYEGFSDLKSLFDRYFDLMYSFSNFMPVPKHFECIFLYRFRVDEGCQPKVFLYQIDSAQVN